MTMTITIALDLEGTLISDETTRIPRPGLYDFLEACKELGRVMIYTMVDEETAEEITLELSSKGFAPNWFSGVEWVDWFSHDTDFKDLDLIRGSDAKHAILVDDHLGFVKPGQEHIWIPINFFYPQDSNDAELENALWKLKRKIKKLTGKPVDVSWPGDKDKKLQELQDEIDDLLLDNIELQKEKDKLTQIILEDE